MAREQRNHGPTAGYEAQLWQVADAPLGSMGAAKYKHARLGLLFPKYISDAFEGQRAKLVAHVGRFWVHSVYMGSGE